VIVDARSYSKKMKLAWRVVVPLVCSALSLTIGLQPLDRDRTPAAIAASGQVLAPIGRQVGWLYPDRTSAAGPDQP
jgi:hypothetical protein